MKHAAGTTRVRRVTQDWPDFSLRKRSHPLDEGIHHALFARAVEQYRQLVAVDGGDVAVAEFQVEHAIADREWRGDAGRFRHQLALDGERLTPRGEAAFRCAGALAAMRAGAATRAPVFVVDAPRLGFVFGALVGKSFLACAFF